MRILTREQTASLIDRDELRRAIADVMVEVSADCVSMPPRVAAQRSGPFGVMAVMPAYVPALDAMATKVVNVFPSNADHGIPTHQAVVLVIDPATGEFQALLDGDVITAERTAAGSAASTDVLARADAAVLSVIGTGVQARSHLLAVSRVRDFETIRVAGRRPEAARRLADEVRHELGRDVEAVSSISEACCGADVICATTDASTPVVLLDDVAPGAHVTSVGFAADGPELDSHLVASATVIVERRAIAFDGYPVGSHDLRRPLDDGLIQTDHVAAELGEVVAGDHPGRSDPSEITLYKSAGMAAQDVAAARLIVERAIDLGVGIEVDR